MKTVIVVEPETRLAALYELELSEAGYSVITVKTAAQALDMLSLRPADLIVTDIGVYNGEATAPESSLFRVLNIPVVINTGYRAGMIRELLSPRVAHVLKSSNIETLKETIHAMLARGEHSPAEQKPGLMRFAACLPAVTQQMPWARAFGSLTPAAAVLP
jgi:DNA-binding response OmpR family regulator